MQNQFVDLYRNGIKTTTELARMSLENVAKLLVATSLLITYSYASEMFLAWDRGDPFERCQGLVGGQRIHAATLTFGL